MHPGARAELATSALSMPRRRGVDVLDARARQRQLRVLSRAAETTVVACDVLGIDEEREEAVDGQACDLRILALPCRASAIMPRRTRETGVSEGHGNVGTKCRNVRNLCRDRAVALPRHLSGAKVFSS